MQEKIIAERKDNYFEDQLLDHLTLMRGVVYDPETDMYYGLGIKQKTAVTGGGTQFIGKVS